VEVKVLLLIKTRRYRESLLALLATMPGMEILLGDNLLNTRYEMTTLWAPDVALYEDDPTNDEQAAALNTAHVIWPMMKVVLLCGNHKSGSISKLSGVDLVLPVDATVGELFLSIDRLLGQKIATYRSYQSDPVTISC
jgi:hypothetical protein